METTANETQPTPRSRLSLAEKLAKITTGWEQAATEAKFANMPLVEFQSITGRSLNLRNAHAAANANYSVLVSNRMAQEKVLREKVQQIISAIRADAAYGPDSNLYRAIGFVPRSERRAPASAGGEPRAQSASCSALERYRRLVIATQDPNANINPEIGGIKREDWVPAGQALEATLKNMEAAKIAKRSLVGEIKAADRVTRALMKKVVASVVSSDTYGENSALYRAMGYIPQNERKRPSRSNSASGASPAAPVPAPASK
jgi:hypothetical protein